MNSFKEAFFLLLQLRNLILKLFLLNFKLFEVVNTTKLRTLITKIAIFFSKNNSYFYFDKQEKQCKELFMCKSKHKFAISNQLLFSNID